MIIWSIKLFSNVRHAIAGRKYPHQLAGAVAIGALLGIIPHGNLLALFVLIVLLSLKINHSMAALTTIGTTFAATKLDPYSHDVGSYILTHPTLGPKMASFWKLPLVPWTDLNNTVVLGSFVIGLAAVLPIFLITYPVFRLFKPRDAEAERERIDALSDEALDAEENRVVLQPASPIAPQTPRRVGEVAAAATQPMVVRIDQSHVVSKSDSETHAEVNAAFDDDSNQSSEHLQMPRMSVETRIDVIRMKDAEMANSPIETTPSATQDEEDTDQQPMDEALNYLLRQLRTSKQKDAA
ncbi:TIGR03546 family protein [Novipirellula sp. SH528]|uniref:TIGR03546 family protein n=1 Tax=Novipirellula sp. SH528 TaxID=3454466 RepID=UPI003FA03C5A